MEEADFDFSTSKIYPGYISKSKKSEEFKNGKKYFGFTKKQLVTIIIFGTANFFSNTVVSLQAPFYPKEAEDRGATATEYGFVMGIFQLVVFIMSPIYGSVIGIVKPRLVFNLGILTTGTCGFLFGFLDYIDDHTAFITLSFVLRILQACGDAAFVTASFTIIALEFPECVASTFATFETCCGIGLIVGPSLGGVLYEVGGFLFPFALLGACLFTVAILASFLLPDVGNKMSGNDSNDEEEMGGNKVGVISMLTIPSVMLAFYSVCVTASSVGFLVATLEPHLRENFGLTPALTGLVFIIDGGMYALSAPFMGKLCDKSGQPKLFTIAGALLTFTGFLLIGPAPLVPLETTMWLVCIGLVLHGIGTGACFVSAFLQALNDSVKNGYLDNVSTYGLVSGLWISAYSIGAFVGPSVGGILLDNYGFKISTIFVLGTQLSVVILTLIFICASKSANSKILEKSDDPEKKYLLKESRHYSTPPHYDALSD